MAIMRLTTTGLLGASLPWSFHLTASTAASESAVSTAFNSAISALFTAATNGLENFMSADVTVTGTIVSTLNATMHQTTATRATLALTGSDANASLPWSTAEVITLRTPLARKNGHGRIYLPPFAEDQVASHVIIAATTAKMKISLDIFWTALNSAGLIPFIYNAKPLKDGTPAFTTTSLTGYDIPNKPATQRRRVSKLVPLRVTGVIP